MERVSPARTAKSPPLMPRIEPPLSAYLREWVSQASGRMEWNRLTGKIDVAFRHGKSCLAVVVLGIRGSCCG